MTIPSLVVALNIGMAASPSANQRTPERKYRMSNAPEKMRYIPTTAIKARRIFDPGTKLRAFGVEGCLQCAQTYLHAEILSSTVDDCMAILLGLFRT